LSEHSKYEFTALWFDQSAENWRQLFKHLQPERVLEIGSYEGRSACFMLDQCPLLKEITCVDTWQTKRDGSSMADVEHRFDRNIMHAQSHRATQAKLRKLKGRSSEILPCLIAAKEQFDWIYVDGSHEAPDVLTDAIYSFHLLRVGGILIFDDYIWRDDVTKGCDILNLPKPAIDAFTNIFHRKLMPYRGAPLYQLYLQKIRD
jgi:predicted O-methyltransferase YrrM